LCILHTHLHQTLRNFVIISNILACFKHHIAETSTFRNLEKPQRLIINDGVNVYVMVVKLLPSFFTNYAITWCTNPNFESSDSSWKAILYPFFSFTSNKPIVTCIKVQNSFRKIITMAKMSTLPLNIQRLKLVEIVATYVRFGSTCKLYLFLPL